MTTHRRDYHSLTADERTCCGRLYASIATLHYHRKSKRAHPKDAPPAPQVFTCCHCDKVYKTPNGRMAHEWACLPARRLPPPAKPGARPKRGPFLKVTPPLTVDLSVRLMDATGALLRVVPLEGWLKERASNRKVKEPELLYA